MKEAAVQRQPLKKSRKLKGMSSSSTGANHLNNVEEPSNALNKSLHVPYNPAANGSEAETHADPIGDTSKTPKVLPAVGIFTVQCAICYKWRIVPTKEKYEEIRGHVLERPFFCQTAREWRPEISCDDPPDIMADGSRLWAIDKPNIAQPPAGWQRLVKIRSEGSSKFADVYYIAPSGETLRSLVGIRRYLHQHPEYAQAGFDMSQFSFQIPKPLQENYVKKRPARAAPSKNVHNLDASQADQVARASPEVDMDLQLSRPGLSIQEYEASVQWAKRKRRTSSKKM